MVRMQIPYDALLLEPRDLDPAEFDSICREFLDASRTAPVVLEVANDDIQYLLFMNESQLYWACACEGEHLRPLRLRDFFLRLRRMQFPQIIAYRTDMILYHSLLVYAQKKPEIKVASTLVDLDELLDPIESDRRNAIVTARDSSSLIVLRCQNGAPVACYRGRTGGLRRGKDAREDFLVAIYTISAKHPLEINLFTDLSVTHADDVRSLPAGFAGAISAFYLSQPPRLVVRLKGRPLKTYPFSGTEISIGRLPENDIVIDNLSVSRKHALVAMDGAGYVVRDLASKNGTLLNGAPVTSARLLDGDVISVGKYDILFQIPTLEGTTPEELDQTVVIPHFRRESDVPAESGAPARSAPRLFRKSAMDEYPLVKETTVLGRGRDSDIRIGGLLGPRVRVEIVRASGDFVLHAKAGRRRVRVNGEETQEKTLESEDLIAIGAEEFVFKV